MPVNSSARVVRFSTFEVNLQTGELRKQGQKLKLQEQPFQVLAALLERPGEVVTREELRSKLWPTDTFVDFDHSLNAAIKRLRDALGESADNPVFIETLARRGYRFIAPIDGSTTSSRPSDAIPQRTKSTLLRPLLATALLLALVAVLLAWMPRRHRSPLRERRLTANSAENAISSAAGSRDGKNLAYTDNTGLYVKFIPTGETHLVPLPPDFSVRVDDWFPDGSHLLVTRQEPSRKASLWKISVWGGSPHQLAEDASGASLSPDGSHVAFRRGDVWLFPDIAGQEEWVMNSDGSAQVKVAVASSDSSLGSPTWSPDGKFIAYMRFGPFGPNDKKSIEVKEWQESNSRAILTDAHLGYALNWLPDGRLLYSLNEGPFGVQDTSLWAIPMHSANVSESARLVTRGHGSIPHVSASADGRLITFVTRSFSPSTYLGTLAQDGTHLLASKRFVDDNENIPYAWTPDSKAILFQSDRNGTSEIFKQAVDQAIAESVASSGTVNLYMPRLTPDGSEILYVSVPKSPTPEARETVDSIFAIPIRGGTPRAVLKDVGSIGNVQCARLASTLCLYSVSKGNTMETYRFDVKNGKTADPPQVDPEGNWSVSPDGSLRAIVTSTPYHDQDTIQLRSTSTGRTRNLVVNGWTGLMNVDWSADGKSLLVAWHNYQWDSALLRVTLDGKASVLVRAGWPGVWFGIESPDGRFLALAQGVIGVCNVWQIENF